MLVDDRKGLRVYRFDSLPDDRVDCLISTRIGGTSAPPYQSLNLGLRVDDDPATVLANRKRLFSSFELSLGESVWCRQIHTDNVRVVDRRDAGSGALDEATIIDAADALVTTTPGITLCVTLADCVPIVIVDPNRPALGLAHAGWGGTVSRIASRTVATMCERLGSDAGDLLAVIGPSIGPESYEVGADVIERAREAYGERSDEILELRADNKALFDLWRANSIDLEEAGLQSGQIEVAEISTAEALDEFYSHRLEHKTGRFIAAATLVSG